MMTNTTLKPTGLRADPLAFYAARCHGCGALIERGVCLFCTECEPEGVCDKCYQDHDGDPPCAEPARRIEGKYLRPDRTQPVGELPDGTPLLPAYFPVRHGERFRRSCSSWDGATGETVGVTLEGQLYRHPKMWGGQGTRPQRWERFKYWDG